MGSARQGLGLALPLQPGEHTLRGNKKKKAGKEAAERDPAACPGSHAFPGLGERHGPAPTRPRPEIPNFSVVFFFFSCLSEAGFVSFSVEKTEGGSQLAPGGRVPERSPARVAHGRSGAEGWEKPERGCVPKKGLCSLQAPF